MGILRTMIDRWVAPKDEPFPDIPVGSLKITTPDGKTTISMDIVTGADERQARRLTALVLGGDTHRDGDFWEGVTMK